MLKVPRVAAIGGAPRPTITAALMSPMVIPMASTTSAADQGFQWCSTRSAKIDALSPALDPMLRSTTPASRANAEHVASSSGTAMLVLTMVRLLPLKKVPPTAARPMITTTTRVIAMLPIGLLRNPAIAFRRGWPGVSVVRRGRQDGPHRADLIRRKPSMATAMTRITPAGTFSHSAGTPKKASVVGIVESRPTLRKVTHRFPYPPDRADARDQGGGDGQEQVVGAVGGDERGLRRGKQHRGEPGQEPGGGEDPEAGLAQRDTAHLRGLRVAADGDGAAADPGPGQQVASHSHDDAPSTQKTLGRPNQYSFPQVDRPAVVRHHGVLDVDAEDGGPGEVGAQGDDDRVQLAEHDEGRVEESPGGPGEPGRPRPPASG